MTAQSISPQKNFLKLFSYLSFNLYFLLFFIVDGHAQQFTKFINSGPVIANSGQYISGLKISNPNGPCVTIKNVSNVTVIGNQIGPCGEDPMYQIGIFVYQANNIQIINNRFHDISSALYALDGAMGKLLFEGNYATKIRGPFPRGQLIQLDKYSGPDITIRCNISDQAIGGYINSDGKGGPEDHINIYKSSGTTQSPIKISNNKIRGGGSLSGGGIIAVDGGNGGNVLIQDNILVDSGQYGIAIPSGTNIEIIGNQILSNRNPWTNVGISIWNQYKNTACSSNKIINNRVNYFNKRGESNPYWNSGNCGEVKEIKNTLQDLDLSQKIWELNFPECATSFQRR